MRSNWRARCEATDDLILAGMLTILVLTFVGGFFLFVVALAALLTGETVG